jgi:hypothetical protein
MLRFRQVASGSGDEGLRGIGSFRSDAERLTSALPQILKSTGRDLVLVDLSNVDTRKVAEISARLTHEVAKRSGRIVAVDLSKARGIERQKAIVKKLAAELEPDFQLDSRLPIQMQAGSILTRAVRRHSHSPKDPLTFLITGFVPESTGTDDLAAWIRSLQNGKAMEGALRAVRLIVASSTPISEWRGPGSGMNVGTRVQI